MKLSTTIRVVLTALGLVLLAGSAVLASETLAVDAFTTVNPEIPAQAPPLAFDKAAAAPFAILPRADYDVPEKILEIGLWNAGARRPTQVGFERPLGVTALVSLPAGDAEVAKARELGVTVERVAGGTMLAARIEVENAYRLRLRLADVVLPAGTEMWVIGDDDAEPFGLELLRQEGDLWTPSVAGGTLELQVLLPEGAATAHFRIDSVAEIFRLDAHGEAIVDPAAPTKGTECIQNAACYGNGDFPGLDTAKQAVAYLEFVDGGSTYICSGTLLNDTLSSGTPYLLTANHCFDSQSSATSLTAYFDYIASSCSGTANLNNAHKVHGSTLLATSSNSDFTLVRLSKNPAGATSYLGWNTSVVGDNVELARLSHPEGDPMSFNQVLSYDPLLTCNGLPTGRFLYSLPDLGATAGGSSGAAVFDENLQVRGQLLGACGPNPDDACDAANDEVDGRFSTSYGAITQFLAPPTPAEDCQPSDLVLCLNNERFRVEGTWRDKKGNTGDFHAVPFTPDSGLFWFFTADNIEFLVKVLTGCNINNHYWVFAAATTNVEYTLTVTDTAHNTSKSYFNKLGNAPPAITDAEAFATCP